MIFFLYQFLTMKLWIMLKIDHEMKQWLPMLCSQYHVCWCPGDIRSQGISSHGFDQVWMEYSIANKQRVNILLTLYMPNPCEKVRIKKWIQDLHVLNTQYLNWILTSVEMVQQVEILPHGSSKDLPRAYSIHGCWWPGDAWTQGSISI